MIIRYLLPLILLSMTAYGQVSMLQGRGGETSVLTDGRGVFLNTSDASLSGSYSFKRSTGGKSRFWGITLKAKATDGVATVFDGNTFKADVDLSAFRAWGFGKLKGPASNFVYVLASLKRARYNILRTAGSTSFDKQTFVGPSLTVGVNRYGGFGNGNSSVLGLSVALGRYTNIDTLKSVQRYVVTSGNVNGQLINILSDRQNGSLGTYTLTTGVRINADAFILALLTMLT